jgi:hypothetical protein
MSWWPHSSSSESRYTLSRRSCCRGRGSTSAGYTQRSLRSSPPILRPDRSSCQCESAVRLVLLCTTRFRGIDSEDRLPSPAVRVPLHRFTCPAFRMAEPQPRPARGVHDRDQVAGLLTLSGEGGEANPCLTDSPPREYTDSFETRFKPPFTANAVEPNLLEYLTRMYMGKRYNLYLSHRPDRIGLQTRWSQA